MKAQKSVFVVLFAAAFVLGAVLQTMGQIVLPEIVVTAANYKYLNAVNPEESAQPVNMLEHYAAAYDVKGAEFYEETNSNYVVSFYIPEGSILAAYDKDGKIIRTAERYKNMELPRHITKAVAEKYPRWSIAKDVYLVNYYSNGTKSGAKVYKLVLENGDKRIRVKINDEDDFL